MKDRVFDQPDGHLFETFEFDDKVAAAFDDMVSRSVPCYGTIQSLVADLSLELHGGRPIIDLGCSTGTTFEAVLQRAGAGASLTLVGVDSSRAMLDACRSKLEACRGDNVVHLERAVLEDLRELPHAPAGVVILCLVVQFLRPAARLPFLRRIHRDLAPGGAVLMVEKTLQPDLAMNKLFLDRYHAFKRSMGYSMVEIARKREALENRLIPFHPEENMDLLREAGFTAVSTFFGWMNFQGYIARRAEG